MKCSLKVRMARLAMELGSPLALNLQFGSFAALVVNNLKVNSVASFVESGHDSIGVIETVAVLAILEGFN